MARHRRLGVATHPNVVTGTVAQEPSAVTTEPALELTSFHSDAMASPRRPNLWRNPSSGSMTRACTVNATFSAMVGS